MINKKRVILICVVSIVVIINMIYGWFNIEFSFSSVILWLLLFVCFISSLIYLTDHHKTIKDAIPILIIAAFFLYNMSLKNDLKFLLYRDIRNDVIKMVQNQELVAEGGSGSVTLPEKSRLASNDGDIYIFSDNPDSPIVGFWIQKAILEGDFFMWVYTTGNESDISEAIKNNLWSDYIVNVREIESNWFFVMGSVNTD